MAVLVLVDFQVLESSCHSIIAMINLAMFLQELPAPTSMDNATQAMVLKEEQVDPVLKEEQVDPLQTFMDNKGYT